MTTDFARQSRRILAAVFLGLLACLPNAFGEPPFVQPDLVVRQGGRQKGDGSYRPEGTRPKLTVRRRDRRPVMLEIELNGDTFAAANRRDVRVAVIGPRRNRRAAFRYFFNDVNVTGTVTTGNFSGFVDPGLNFGDLAVEIVPKKKRVRRSGTIAGVTIRAFDEDGGTVVDSVRGVLFKR